MVYKLPGGQKFSIKLSLLSVGFPQRRPLNLIKRPRFINSLLPRGAIYKPPRAQLINNPFFAIYQVFALSIKSNPFLAILGSCPGGPARRLQAPQQEQTPCCLAAILNSQPASPKSSLKMPPNLLLLHKRFFPPSFKIDPANWVAIERQKLSRGNLCRVAFRCLSGPSGW